MRINNMHTLVILAIGLAIPTVSLADERIIGGSETTIEQYPFAAALLLAPNGLSYHTQECVGSIISIRAVLTAAQCFQRHPSPSQWRVRVGSSSSRAGGIIFATLEITRHNNYNPQTMYNDVAILKIIGGFTFNEAVTVGKLPSSNVNLATNTTVNLVGWGAHLDQGPYSANIRHAQVRVVSLTTCRNSYATFGYTLGANTLCTTSTFNNVIGDACHGDMGGPVVDTNDIIVGIISWTFECGNPSFYGVNTRVGGYLSWIRSNP